ncbi:MAG: LAS superfamily LD-carboxypeptidase LdcB [Flavobacteriales bacterium]|jgi:LAS superfamily LD-carboxypeptidase LdcB
MRAKNQIVTRELLIFGLSEKEIDFDSLDAPVHSAAVVAITQLKDLAWQDGYDLRIASGFRNFSKQLQIWNEKATGIRPILGLDGRELERKNLSDDACVDAILRWSALPGASRHHWGTEIDIYDANSLCDGRSLQLTLEECDAGGDQFRFHQWLNDQMTTLDDMGFYRPYAVFKGGVAREPWHLSYRPLAEHYYSLHSLLGLKDVLVNSKIELKSSVLKNVDKIYTQYFLNT